MKRRAFLRTSEGAGMVWRMYAITLLDPSLSYFRIPATKITKHDICLERIRVKV